MFHFFVAFTSPHTLGGVVALSAWLPLSTTFPQVRFYYLKQYDNRYLNI